MTHDENAFATLTYRDEVRSLEPGHVRDWLKRLRHRIEPAVIRYFVVGEYGERSMRPHYHAALFGYPACRGGPVRPTRNGGRECQCQPCLDVRSSWGFGHTMIGMLERRSAQYIAGYTVKKMTRFTDGRLEGRYPEFARMSLKPGIGAGVVKDVASVMKQYGLPREGKDVPVALAHGKAELPLGRYLRGRLRKELGLDEKAPQHVLDALRAGLLPVFQAAFDVAPGQGSALVRRGLVMDAIEAGNKQSSLNMQAKSKIHKRRTL